MTPYLYGACIEDVNHEIYGGLYDQKIFGESFEEPVPNPQFEDFTAYEGNWSVRDNNVFATSHPGAKLVYDKTSFGDGCIETDYRLYGLIVKVRLERVFPAVLLYYHPFVPEHGDK